MSIKGDKGCGERDRGDVIGESDIRKRGGGWIYNFIANIKSFNINKVKI